MEFLAQAFAFGIIIAVGGVSMAKLIEWFDNRDIEKD